MWTPEYRNWRKYGPGGNVGHHPFGSTNVRRGNPIPFEKGREEGEGEEDLDDPKYVLIVFVSHASLAPCSTYLQLMGCLLKGLRPPVSTLVTLHCKQTLRRFQRNKKNVGPKVLTFQNAFSNLLLVFFGHPWAPQVLSSSPRHSPAASLCLLKDNPSRKWRLRVNVCCPALCCRWNNGVCLFRYYLMGKCIMWSAGTEAVLAGA